MNHSKRLLIVVTYTAMFMLGLYLSMYQITLLNISEEYSIDSVIRGSLVAVQFIGICIPPLFIAWLAGKTGKKNVLMFSMTILVAGLLSVYLTNNLLCFIISIFFIGGGFSVTEATLSAAISDEFPQNAQKHISFSQAMFSIGAFISPLVSEFLLNRGIRWKSLFLLCGVFFALLLVMLTFIKIEKSVIEYNASGSKDILGIIREKNFIFLALTIFVYIGIEEIIGFFTDSYFNISVGAPGLGAVALSLYWAAMIPSRLITGIVKMSHKKFIAICSIGITISLVAAMLIPVNAVKLVLFAFSGLFCGPVWGLIMTSVAQQNSWNSAASMNFLVSVSGLGGAVFPFTAGILISFSGEYSAYFLAAVAGILMLIAFGASQKKQKG
ncbi:MAG: MFS transporter [Acetivibrionales bacterium]|jgi:FHS family glucose/mannose:H+ symporter-like MFS transporter